MGLPTYSLTNRSSRNHIIYQHIPKSGPDKLYCYDNDEDNYYAEITRRYIITTDTVGSGQRRSQDTAV